MTLKINIAPKYDYKSITRNSQETSTYMCSRMIFVSRFLRFWWKFSGKRARIASAEDRSRNTASLVRRCRAWSSCGTVCGDGAGGGGLVLPEGL